MSSPAEVRRNLHEFRNLRSIASRAYVKSVLDREINICQTLLDDFQAATVVNTSNESGTAAKENKTVPQENRTEPEVSEMISEVVRKVSAEKETEPKKNKMVPEEKRTKPEVIGMAAKENKTISEEKGTVPEVSRTVSEVVRTVVSKENKAVSEESKAASEEKSRVQLLPTTKITSYAWDQNDRFVKFYITIMNVQAVPKEHVNVHFKENSFKMTANDVFGKNYYLVMKDLLNSIDTEASYFKQKKDTLLILLRKKENKEWDYLTKREEMEKKKKFETPKLEEGEDTHEFFMNMLKKMYDEGDDDMKRNIAKAYQEGRNKKTPEL